MLPNDSLNASSGASVTFSTSFPPQQTSFTTIDWKFERKTIIFFNEITKPGPGYEDRANISLSTGSLELRNLSVNDSGQYSVVISPRQQASQEGSATLNVYGEYTAHVVSTVITFLISFKATSSLENRSNQYGVSLKVLKN